MFNARTAVRTVRLGTRQLLAGALVAIALAGAPAAHAQFGGRASFGEAFQPDLLQRDLPLMISTLNLEEWQRPILEQLVEDYTVAFNSGVDGLKERMKEAAKKASENAQRSGGNGDAILEKVMEPWAAWRVEKRQLFDKFVADLQSQLGPQQKELWPRFERALRRERQLHEGDLSGESVDLWAVLARLQVSPAEAEAARPAMDVYEIALDEALVNRMTRIEQLDTEMRDAMRQMNYEKGADVQDRIMNLRILVRNANDEGIEKVAAALGARGTEFRKAALESGYPDAFRKHPVLTLIDQSLGIETLTTEQRGQIEALRAELEAASAEANLKYYEMLRVEEPKAPRRKVQMQLEKKANGGKSAPNPTPQSGNLGDPILKMRVEREQMGEPFRTRLMAILSPEQAPLVPDATKLDPKAVRPKSPDDKHQPVPDDERVGNTRIGGEGRDARGGNRRDPRGGSGSGQQRDGGGQSPPPPAGAK